MRSESVRACVGIIVNPRAGTDVRRLTAGASPTTDMWKISAIRRIVVGVVEAGVTTVVLSDDRRSLATRACDRLPVDVEVEVLPTPPADGADNTVRAAAEMRRRGVGALVVLGGDGTNRDVVRGWRDAPVVALSTGTNNVFPRHVEPTVAGHAAGAVARGAAPLAEVAHRAMVIDLEVDGRPDDLGLVDVALLDGRFTGSRAVWETGGLRELLVTIAEPDAIGLSAAAAAVETVGRHERAGLHVRFTSAIGRPVRAPIAPGRYATMSILDHRRLAAGDEIRWTGPAVVAIDGERDVVLGHDDTMTATLADDGPRVVDVAAAMRHALHERREGT